jgi:hypothetical protein
MKLYEITEAMKGLEEMLENGTPIDELADAIESVKGGFQERAESILFVLANLTGDIDKYKAEEKRLAERRKQAEKQAEKLKEYLLFNMGELNESEVSNGVKTAKIRKAAPVLVVTDEDKIPIQYKKISTSVALDKCGLLKALKDLPQGEAIEGAEVGAGKPTLQIK